MKIFAVIGIAALASGCATKQPASTYWTQKAGVVVVHHVVGTIDHTEKLGQKALSADQVSSYRLAEKGKYFSVTEHDDKFVPEIKPEKAKKDAKKDADGTKIAEVTSELHQLRRQISAVSEENQRLQEQINASAKQSPDHGDSQQTAQAHEESGAPRLSQ